MKLDRKGGQAMFAFGLVAICILCGGVGQILMKNGMSQVGQIGGWTKLFSFTTVVSLVTNGYVVGGLALYAAAAFL